MKCFPPVSIGVTFSAIVLTVSTMDGRHHSGTAVAIRLACITGAIGLASGTIYYLRRTAS